MRHSSKAGLFLMELIAAILIFSIAGAVCLQLFAKARVVSTESKELSHAVSAVQAQTEIFYGNTGSVTDADIFYDKDFKVCSREGAAYELKAKVSSSGRLMQYNVAVGKISGGEIYSLCVKKVIQE